MKVLAITPRYLSLLGGIEILVDSLAGPPRAEGVAISVVTDDMGKLRGRDLIDETPVHRLNFTGAVRSGRPGEPLQVLQQLRRVFDEERPDLVHMHCVTGSGAWYVDRLSISSRLSVPFLVTQHGLLEAELDPYQRYVSHGRAEGRQWRQPCFKRRSAFRAIPLNFAPAEF